MCGMLLYDDIIHEQIGTGSECQGQVFGQRSKFGNMGNIHEIKIAIIDVGSGIIWKLVKDFAGLMKGGFRLL